MNKPELQATVEKGRRMAALAENETFVALIAELKAQTFRDWTETTGLDLAQMTHHKRRWDALGEIEAGVRQAVLDGTNAEAEIRAAERQANLKALQG